jgi:glutamate dehydrogenase (NAD(P)+)
MSETFNAFDIAREQLDNVAKLINLDRGVHTVLRSPKRELTVNFPVKMDTGETKVFTGYRVQHNDARGPSKGGLRFHPDTDIDEVRCLYAIVAFKK